MCFSIVLDLCYKGWSTAVLFFYAQIRYSWKASSVPSIQIYLHLHDADGIATTGSSFQFQDRFGRNDTFTDNISLRICLIIGIFCIGIDGCNILLVCIQEVQFQS